MPEAASAIHAMLQRQIVDLWTHGRLDIVDAMYAADCIDHMPVPGQAGGRPGLKQAVAIFRAAMPDLTLRLVRTLAQGTPAAGRGVDVWQLTGTHTGDALFGLPASGRSVAFAGIDWLRIENGQVAELWHIEDMAMMADQLGMPIPPVAAPEPFSGPAPARTHTAADAAMLAIAQRHLAGWRHGDGDLAARLPAATARTAAPDLAVHVADWLVDGGPDGGHVACRRLITGTHTGAPLFGLPPRGKRFAINAMAVVAIGRDGRVEQQWLIADLFSLCGQIGG